MPKTLEAITRDIMELPRAKRLEVARMIFDLDEGPIELGSEAAWDAEIRARLKAYDEGHVETKSYEAFREEMERQYGR